jgi:glycosyltransferase involved in cell wall biosynthesis
MAAQGHNVFIISRISGLKKSYLDSVNGINVLYLPQEPYWISKIFPFFKFNKFGALFYSKRAFNEMRRIERNYSISFDVIEASDWGAEGYYFVKKQSRKTIIKCDTPSFVSESFNPNNPNFLGSFVKKLEKRTLISAKNIVCNSELLIRQIEKHLNATILFKQMYLPLPNKILEKDKYNAYPFSKTNRLKVLFVGRVENRKGIYQLLNVTQALHARGLHISLDCFGATTPLKGGGNTISEIEQRHIPYIKFHGHISREEVLKIYKNYDLLIMPSLFESFGLVALEAIMTGLPTIISKNTGAAEFFNNSPSILFETEKDLFEKIINVYENYEQYIDLFKALQKSINDDLSKKSIFLDIENNYYRLCNLSTKMEYSF